MVLKKNNNKLKTKDILKEIKDLVKNYLTKEKTKIEKPKSKKVTKKRNELATKKVEKKIIKHKAKKISTRKSTLAKRRRFEDIAPEEMTGISSQNIGETQHSESPQASALVHIPLSNPASNVTGSNALSSLLAQQAKHYNKPISFEELYSLSTKGKSNPNIKIEKQTAPQPGANANQNSDPKNTQIGAEKLTRKEKNYSMAKINEELDNMDKTAITIGGSLGSMSNRHGKREK